MICEKCGTENSNGSKFCKKCGELLESIASEEKEKVAVLEKVQEENKDEIEIIKMETEKIRSKTSPLAVRMQEKLNKEDKKIKGKLKRSKVWATIAIVASLIFILENAFIIVYELGYLDSYINVENQEDEVIEQPEVLAPEKVITETQNLSGEWTYTYKLEKYHDADLSLAYATKTEEIESTGKAVFSDIGDNHMVVAILPGEMKVDMLDVETGTTPEAFNAWYKDGKMNIQMKGTEQKFFAPGGYEPLCISFTPEYSDKTRGSYVVTYDKTVTGMNMRYLLSISFEKKDDVLTEENQENSAL